MTPCIFILGIDGMSQGLHDFNSQGLDLIVGSYGIVHVLDILGDQIECDHQNGENEGIGYEYGNDHRENGIVR